MRVFPLWFSHDSPTSLKKRPTTLKNPLTPIGSCRDLHIPPQNANFPSKHRKPHAWIHEHQEKIASEQQYLVISSGIGCESIYLYGLEMDSHKLGMHSCG